MLSESRIRRSVGLGMQLIVSVMTNVILHPIDLSSMCVISCKKNPPNEIPHNTIRDLCILRRMWEAIDMQTVVNVDRPKDSKRPLGLQQNLEPGKLKFTELSVSI